MRGRSKTWRRTLFTVTALSVLTIAALPTLGVAGEAPDGQGLLRVKTNPAVDAELFVDGSIRSVGAIRGLPLQPGSYEVCFGDVADHLPAPCETVTITDGQTTTLIGDYEPAGTLHVTTTPSDLDTQIVVDGVGRDAGATTLPVAAGTRDVCATAVPGYNEVACQQIDVLAGTNATVDFDFEPTSGPQPEPDLVGSDGRVVDGLVALYEFSNGSGSTITDTAGVLDGMDLNVTDTSATNWGTGTLTLNSPTLAATTSAPTALYERIQSTGEFTVEAWIEPANLTQNGPARILSLGNNTSDANFVLGQGSYQGASDLIEARHQRVGDYKLPTTTGTLDTNLTHVAATRTTDGTVTIYLDGQPQSSRQMQGDPATWDLTHRLGLGAELDGQRPWLGTYHLTAIYDTALTPNQITTNHTAGPGTNR